MKAAIGWLKQKNEGGVGSMLNPASGRRQFYLVIQNSNEVVVLDFKNKTHFSFDFQSPLPFVLFPAYQNSLSFFFYNPHKSTIDLLKIAPNEEIQLKTIYSWKHRTILAMQACFESNELMIMDDKPSMRRLGFNSDDNEEGDL